jgi:hypothetical protein
MTKGKDKSQTASRKGSFFDPKPHADHILNMVVLDREELKEIVERILKHAYEMGRYEGMQEIRDEWIEYMTKQLERNQ